MRSTNPVRSRGGVLAAVIVGASVVSIGAAATLTFNWKHRDATAVTAHERLPDPQEAAVLLNLAGITPETMAAAGLTSLEFDGVFDASLAYCLQAEYVEQIRLASKALNEAKERATKKPLPQTTPPRPTVTQAKSALDDKKNAAFNWVTGSLSSEKKALLAQIRANSAWKLPPYYLTVERTDKQWLALRGALSAKRYADKTGHPLKQEPAAVISTADANATVASAKANSTARAATFKDSWKTKSRPAQPNP